MSDRNRDYGDYDSQDFTFHLLVLRLLHLFLVFTGRLQFVFKSVGEKMESCELFGLKKKPWDKLLTAILTNGIEDKC